MARPWKRKVQLYYYGYCLQALITHDMLYDIDIRHYISEVVAFCSLRTCGLMDKSKVK